MHDLTAYTEREPLGSGGFADVVQALNMVNMEVVALKKSRPAPDCVARTKREIELQRRLLHGNVMPILDWATDGSWFVMPVARGDLAAVHELEPVKNAGLLRLVEDVGAALAAAHRRGFVHRDLSPGNILWLRDRWVVADWGFVKLPPGQARTKLTRTGVGTECFTPPEVYKDGNVATPACDIYSLGRVVGWLLLGAVLEPGRPVPLDPASPWARFVMETTRDDPAERPQSIDAAVKFLEPVFDTLSESIPDLPTTPSLDIDVKAAAVDAFKVLLQDPTRRIQLEELLDRETEAAFLRLSPEAFSVQVLDQGAPLDARLRRYVDSCNPLTDLVINGCAYGSEAQAPLLTTAIRRIGHPSGEWNGITAMLSLRQFPTTLLMYAGGVAAVGREQWANLAAVTTAPRLARRSDDEEGPAVVRAAAAMVMSQEHAQTLPGLDRHHTPASDWLFAVLREPLRRFYRLDQDFELAFDRFEYIVAMVVSSTRAGGWVPPGRFAWKTAERRRYKQATVGDGLKQELAQSGATWGPVRAGMFRDADEASSALERVEKSIGANTWM